MNLGYLVISGTRTIVIDNSVSLSHHTAYIGANLYMKYLPSSILLTTIEHPLSLDVLLIAWKSTFADPPQVFIRRLVNLDSIFKSEYNQGLTITFDYLIRHPKAF